jgi:putative oxidoreductase
LGLRPGRVHAAGAGFSETAGGALVAAGLLTPVGSTLLSGTMITAIRKVHAAHGPWVAEGGYEYNLVLLAALFAINDVGPGEFSLDERLGIRRAGAGWAIAQLAAGAIGSTAVVAMGERQPPSSSSASAEAAAQPGASESGNGDGAPQVGPNGGQAVRA